MRNGMRLLLFSEANGRGRRFPLASVSLDEGDDLLVLHPFPFLKNQNAPPLTRRRRRSTIKPAYARGKQAWNRSGGYFVHPSSYVDDDVIIGKGTKVWHFCHLQSGCRIGENCSLGQNVNISNNVIVGDGCKLQNNVSLYEGVILEDHVFCGPSCVFTNDLTPRARYPKGRCRL